MIGCNYTWEVIALALFLLSVALPGSSRKGASGFVLQCNFFVGKGFFGYYQTGYLCSGHSFPRAQNSNYTARGRLLVGLFFFVTCILWDRGEVLCLLKAILKINTPDSSHDYLHGKKEAAVSNMPWSLSQRCTQGKIRRSKGRWWKHWSLFPAEVCSGPHSLQAEPGTSCAPSFFLEVNKQWFSSKIPDKTLVCMKVFAGQRASTHVSCQILMDGSWGLGKTLHKQSEVRCSWESELGGTFDTQALI